MQRPLLNDKDEYPDDNVLLRYLGRTKTVWDAFTSTISSSAEPMALEWRYYNDGKAWLCKLVHKKKTVCWISVWPRYFRTTFYFRGKHSGGIKALPIDAGLKKDFRSRKSVGTLKPLVVIVRTKKTLKDVFELIAYKSTKA